MTISSSIKLLKIIVLNTESIVYPISIVLFFIIIGIFIITCYKKPTHGIAIVRTGQGGTQIAFERGIFAIPSLHRIELMNIKLHKIEVKLKPEDLITKDNKPTSINASFYIRVNRSIEDAKNVALSFGCENTFKTEEVYRFFAPKFIEALKIAALQFNAHEIKLENELFKSEIYTIVGINLNGFMLDDATIDEVKILESSIRN